MSFGTVFLICHHFLRGTILVFRLQDGRTSRMLHVTVIVHFSFCLVSDILTEGLMRLVLEEFAPAVKLAE